MYAEKAACITCMDVQIVSLRIYQAQFLDRQMPECRIFLQLHSQFRETDLFPLARHEDG